MERLHQITLKQLRALHAVDRLGRITTAADRLNLTPPAVHNQLKSLEDAFGCALLDRDSPEGLKPTAEGRALLVAYREARAALERAIRDIDALAHGQSGAVVLGVVSTGKYFAPGIVARIRRELPDIDVILRIGNRSRTIEALESRELDLCIMGRPPRRPMVDATPLGDHPHLVVAAPNHPLAGRKALTAEEIVAQHFVVREPGSGTRIIATRYIDELGGRDVDMTEMESNETIKQAVMSGLGIAFISGHTVVEELRSGRLVALDCPGVPITRTWFIMQREDQTASMATRTVRDWIEAHAAELLPTLPA
jgi:DNA-binding transcriptional LysR family regulator